MRLLRVHLRTYKYSTPICRAVKWGVLLTQRSAKVNFLIWLGSLPLFAKVFTHYAESASPIIFLQCEVLMKAALKDPLLGLPAI